MNKKQNKYGLIIQLLLIFAVIIFLVMAAFDIKYLHIAQIIAGVTLLSIAYNNHTVYNRKYLTIIYIVFGIIVILEGIIKLING